MGSFFVLNRKENIMGLQIALYRETAINDSDRASGIVDLSREVWKNGTRIDTPYKINVSKIRSIVEEVEIWYKDSWLLRWVEDEIVYSSATEYYHYYVALEDIKKLQLNIFRILSRPEGRARDEEAKKLLPYDALFEVKEDKYDEAYYKSLKESYKVLTDVVDAAKQNDDGSTYYYFKISF